MTSRLLEARENAGDHLIIISWYEGAETISKQSEVKTKQSRIALDI